VDVRIFKPTHAGEPDLPNDPEDPQARKRLEWGFAGTAESTPAKGESPAHTVWSHWVDSTTIEEVKDEGYMWPLENGDVLEKGAMKHPETGKVTEYEEVWRDLDVEGEKVSTVLKMEDASKKARGMVIRIGQWMQGVMRVDDQITVERWHSVEVSLELGC
jgi:hypothetical protein